MKEGKGSDEIEGRKRKGLEGRGWKLRRDVEEKKRR